MRPWPSTAGLALALTGMALAAASIAPGTEAAFTDTTRNGGNAFAAAPDWEAPRAVRSTAVAEADGATTLRPGDAYRIYARVTDGGNPASGARTVTADARAVTAGATAAAFEAGAYPVGGDSYDFRSEVLVVDAGAPAGDHAYALALTDAAGNARTETGIVVTVASG
jgi:hypothetical protein